MPTVKIPPVLRAQTGGEAEVSVDGATVGDVLRSLADRHPDTATQLFSPAGELNRYVNVYLNDEDVRVLGGLGTAVGEGDTVVILPAMAGGTRPAFHLAGAASNQARAFASPSASPVSSTRRSIPSRSATPFASAIS